MRNVLCAWLAVVFLAVVAAPAVAQEDLRAAAEAALAEGGAPAASALLEAENEREPFDAARRVEAAEVALDLLDLLEGSRVAATLVESVLAQNSGDRAAWTIAIALRTRLRDSIDLDTGVWFLTRLSEIYPAEPRYRYYLANLLVRGGRTDDAQAVYEELRRSLPDDAYARFNLATIEESRGNPDEALALLDEIIEINDDVYAHSQKVAILRLTMRDYDRAQVALDAAWTALDSVESDSERNKHRARLEWEREQVTRGREQRTKARDLRSRLDRILLGLGVGWLVLLGGGVALLRRRGWM